MQLEKVMYARLFSKLQVGGIDLKNRLIMAPTYLGYAGAGGTASPLLLDHYRLMAASGVAMVVVENATIDHPTASGSKRTLRVDTEKAGFLHTLAAAEGQGIQSALRMTESPAQPGRGEDSAHGAPMRSMK